MTEQQLARMAKRRLAILRHAEEITSNVSLTCATTASAASASPRSSPNATRTGVVGKIMYLRQHDHFSPAKIAMHLKRYHEIQISKSVVWRILKRLEAQPPARLPAPQAPRPPLEAL